MFKDTKEGQTHYHNDRCGEPAHNCCVKCYGAEGDDYLCSNPSCDCHNTSLKTYSDYSHTHCWDNKNNPCGLSKHDKCCLCGLTSPKSWEERFDEKFAHYETFLGLAEPKVISPHSCEECKKIKSFITEEKQKSYSDGYEKGKEEELFRERENFDHIIDQHKKQAYSDGIISVLDKLDKWFKEGTEPIEDVLERLRKENV